MSRFKDFITDDFTYQDYANHGCISKLSSTISIPYHYIIKPYEGEIEITHVYSSCHCIPVYWCATLPTDDKKWPNRHLYNIKVKANEKIRFIKFKEKNGKLDNFRYKDQLNRDYKTNIFRYSFYIKDEEENYDYTIIFTFYDDEMKLIHTEEKVLPKKEELFKYKIETCSICLDNFDEEKEDYLIIKCSHKFHKKCFLQYMRNRYTHKNYFIMFGVNLLFLTCYDCPVCRDIYEF